MTVNIGTIAGGQALGADAIIALQKVLTGNYYQASQKGGQAGSKAVMQLFNPSGSGKILIVDYCFASNSIGDGIYLGIDDTERGNAPVATNTTNLDFRSTNTPVGDFRSGAVLAATLDALPNVWVSDVGSVGAPVVDKDRPIILGEGDGLNVFPQTDGSRIWATFGWYESEDI